MSSDIIERNAVHVQGEGSSVVLVHGFGCDQTMWLGMEAHLAQYRVIRYDLTGMGMSDHGRYEPTRYESLEAHADDLIDIVDAVGQGPVTVVGHSVSAVIVGLAAARRPDLFAGVVMICPSACYTNEDGYQGGFEREAINGLLGAMKDNYVGWSGQLASMVGGGGEVSQQLEQRFCRNDPVIMEHFAAVTFGSDHRQDLSRMQAPTLVIATTNDPIAPPSATEYVLDRLPSAQRAVIDCHGHAPHMAEPATTATAIQNFMEGHGAGPV